MFEIALICMVSFGAAILTFFSGFGLGTILMPFVAIFVPLDVAIAITAVVHFSNNIFKIWLVGKNVSLHVLLYFGIFAFIFAILGAVLLSYFMGFEPLYEYMFFNINAVIEPIKVAIGVVILIFVLLESTPKFANITVDKKYLPLGGMLSGFFGGLSGHQGAFRSMFLLKAGLSKEEFIATGIAIAIIVDVGRLFVYNTHFLASSATLEWELALFATLAAFLGSFLGAKMLKKITLEFVRNIVSVLLVLFAFMLIAGIL